MSEHQVSETSNQKKRTVLGRVSMLIFGKNEPEIYTVMNFYIQLFWGIVFLLWSILSVVMLQFHDVIKNVKNIHVQELLMERGEKLGFDGLDFYHRIFTLNSIGIICWTLFLIGLILLYRQKRSFIFFTLGSCVFYVGMLIFYMSFGYYNQEVGMFDKIGFTIICVVSIIQFFILKKVQTGSAISFFQDEESIE